ncbi:MAG: hypothetical protein P4L16_00605 [Chlamydiales bacterium]|nr:hypothetical protein [Chlamydiales bacterium]
MKKYSLIALTVLCTNVGAQEFCPNLCLDFSMGPSYVIPYGYGTSGDINFPASPSANISGSNLEYQKVLGWDVSVGTTFFQDFRFSVDYEYAASKISTRSAVLSEDSYNADLFLNTLLLKSRYIAPWTFGITRFYVEAGIGMANLATSQQRLITTADLAPFTLPNHNVWRLAFSAEVGAKTYLYNHLSLEYGVRYTNYGRYSSGVNLIEQRAQLYGSVSAHLWSIAPYVSLDLAF